MDEELFKMMRTDTPESPFVRACADNNLAEVRRRILAGEDVNQVDNRDRDLRLEEKIPLDPNQQYAIGSPASFAVNGIIMTWNRSGLHVAMQAHNLELMRMLLKFKADPYLITDQYTGTPIMEAVTFGFVEGLRVMQREFGYNFKNENGIKPDSIVLSAVGFWNWQKPRGTGMLEYLVEERGLDLHYVTDNGRNIVYEACGEEVPPYFLDYCYKKGLSPHQQFDIQSSGVKIHPAVIENKEIENTFHVDVSKFESDMSDVKRYLGITTPLNLSIFRGQVGQVEMHLKHKANPHFPDRLGLDAYGLLDELKGSDFEMPEHDLIHEMLDQHIAAARPSLPVDFVAPRFRL